MIVFKNYFKIIKSFIPVILIYLSIFTFMAVLMTSETVNDFEALTTRVAIINNDPDSILTNAFINYIKETSEIVEIEGEEVIADYLFSRQVDFVMIIPEAFSERFMLGEAINIETRRIPDSVASMNAQMLYNRFWNVANVYRTIGMDKEQISNIILTDLAFFSEVRLIEENTEELLFVNAFYNFSNYTILATILFIVGTIMLIFNNQNMKRRNLVSPVSYKKQTSQLFLGNICIMLLVWLLYVIISILLYGKVMFSNNGLLMMANSFIFCITVLSLAFFIGNLIKNRTAQRGVIDVLALGTSFISGAFVPQILLGDFVLNIARFFPSYWFIRNNNEITNLVNFNMTNMMPILVNMLIILGFGLLFFILTNLVNKRNLKS